MNLSAKHEQFAQLVAKGILQADAYRQAVSARGTDKTVWENASKLAAKVAPRIEALRAAAQGRASQRLTYGWEQAMEELDKAKRDAEAAGKFDAVISAIRQKCKISGLETEDRKNDRSPFAEMTDEQLAEFAERKMQEAGFTLQ